MDSQIESFGRATKPDETASTHGDDRLRHLAARLRFRHLQLLLALRDHGSLHGAAGALHLTQPSLSKMLAEVEQSFGQRLFDRGARGLTPTPAGRVATHGAQLLMNELQRLGRETAAPTGEMVLRLGTPPFVALSHLPRALQALSALAPELRVELHENAVPALLEALLAGQLDALISHLDGDVGQAHHQALRHIRLFSASFEVIAPAAHPLARRRSVSWLDLAQADWVLPGAHSALRSGLAECFARAGTPMPAPVVESSSPMTNVGLVAAGLGLCAVPTDTLNALEVPGTVVRLPVRPRLLPGSVGLYYRAHAEHPRIDALRRALSTLQTAP